MHNALAFLKAWINNPLAMGTVVPSSVYLAKEMVSHIASRSPGIVVELGAGTGVVTEAILNAGIHPNDLIVLERSPILVSRIRQRFPQACVVEGDAVELQNLLRWESRPINTVISSLPLRALPQSTTEMILRQIAEILCTRGRYIQFTYGISPKKRWFQNYFYRINSKRIWRNLPPARVDVYETIPHYQE